MNYILDEKKNLSEFNIGTPDYVPLTLAEVGDTCLADGIEVLCIYFNDEAELSYRLFVDKNHDLSYYIVGSDMVNSNEYDHSPGTFGYEWGGYMTETRVTATAIGTGLTNTNTLISKNLQSYTTGWWVVWDKVKEFRTKYSDSWYVPSKDELNLIYQQKDNLANLSTSNATTYWSCSEYSSAAATPGSSTWTQRMINGSRSGSSKSNHIIRVRLCYYLECPDPTIT